VRGVVPTIVLQPLSADPRLTGWLARAEGSRHPRQRRSRWTTSTASRTWSRSPRASTSTSRGLARRRLVARPPRSGGCAPPNRWLGTSNTAAARVLEALDHRNGGRGSPAARHRL